MKWLAREGTGQRHPGEESHNIKPVYDVLSDEHKNRLEMAFDDAMRFYGYAYLKYDGLGDYLQKHGAQDNFNQMRYFLLPGESDDKMKGIVFGVHMRLIEEVHRLLIGADYQPLDSTIGWTIEAAIPITWSWSSEDVERESAVSCAIALLQKEANPVASALRDVVQQGLGNAKVKSLLGELLEKIKEMQSEHPTYVMMHYLCTLEYRLPGLEPSINVQPSVEWVSKSIAKVHTPSGEWLGFIERRHDATWVADSFGSSGIYMETDDAIRCVVNNSTTVVRIDGREKRLVVSKAAGSDGLLSAGVMVWVGDNDWGETEHDSPKLELVFWDESHGLSPGKKFNAVQETGEVCCVVDGIVEQVDGHRVSILTENAYWDLSSLQQDA